MGDGYDVVWTVFDFIEEKNSIFTRILQMAKVDGFISNVLIRLQKFKEVDEDLYKAQYVQGQQKSDALSRSGIAAKVQTVYGPEDSLPLP